MSDEKYKINIEKIILKFFPTTAYSPSNWTQKDDLLQATTRYHIIFLKNYTRFKNSITIYKKIY